jgi:hypothetical protein
MRAEIDVGDGRIGCGQRQRQEEQNTAVIALLYLPVEEHRQQHRDCRREPKKATWTSEAEQCHQRRSAEHQQQEVRGLGRLLPVDFASRREDEYERGRHDDPCLADSERVTAEKSECIGQDRAGDTFAEMLK